MTPTLFPPKHENLSRRENERPGGSSSHTKGWKKLRLGKVREGVHHPRHSGWKQAFRVETIMPETTPFGEKLMATDGDSFT